MGSVEARLEAVFNQFDSARDPGFVAAVARPGVPDCRRAGGVSSIESGARNGEQTRMRIGSTTKQFTCLGVMLLAEEGLLSIDDDIRAHLPELPMYPRPVAIRHLMSNTGGLRCYLDLIGILAGFDRAISAQRARRLMLRQRSVNFDAGERLIYCNGGYLLLSMLIERVAKTPLGEFFAKRIFEPLGMTRTSFEPDDSKLLPESATLHQRHPDGSYHRGTIGIGLSGDGAIVSSVEDLLRWLRNMDSPVIGNPKTWSAMLSAGSDNEHGYGFGLMHNAYRGIRVVEHGGTVFGGRCQSLKVPDHGIDIAIMSNASDVFPAQIADRVLDALLEGKLDSAAALASAQKTGALAGTFYSAETGDLMRIVTKDDGVFMAGESGEAPLYELPEGGFRTNFASLSVAIREANGAIEVREGGHRAVLGRVQAESCQSIDPYRGLYVNADCEAQAAIDGATTPRMVLESPYGSTAYALEPLTQDVWLAQLQDTWFPLRLLVEFRSGPDGELLWITTGRTKRLQFDRRQKGAHR